MTVVNFDFSKVRFVFSFFMIFAVAIARMFAVFVPPAFAYLCCRKEVSLTLKEMKIIWYSGLVRGKFYDEKDEMLVQKRKKKKIKKIILLTF